MSGRFLAHVQIGSIQVSNIQITVANVPGDRLLSMDYLTTADAWIGVRDGKLHMRAGERQLSCQLRATGSVTTQAGAHGTQGVVRCSVDPPYEEEQSAVSIGMR